jgi:hypothetical protein
MNKQILVAMKRSDRAGDLLPYVEKVSRRGMKVIFMVPYPTDGFCWAREEFGHKGIEEAKILASYYTWETNLQKAKERLLPALKVLAATGIEGEVTLYAGGMRRAVADYAAKSDVHLIVTRAAMGSWICGIVDSVMSVFRSFKRASFAPVLLINPRALP